MEETQTSLNKVSYIQSFIKTEREKLEAKRKFYLKQKGDYSFHNLNSIQRQLGILERLENVL